MATLVKEKISKEMFLLVPMVIKMNLRSTGVNVYFILELDHLEFVFPDLNLENLRTQHYSSSIHT